MGKVASLASVPGQLDLALTCTACRMPLGPHRSVCLASSPGAGPCPVQACPQDSCPSGAGQAGLQTPEHGVASWSWAMRSWTGRREGTVFHHGVASLAQVASRRIRPSTGKGGSIDLLGSQVQERGGPSARPRAGHLRRGRRPGPGTSAEVCLPGVSPVSRLCLCCFQIPPP